MCGIFLKKMMNETTDPLNKINDLRKDPPREITPELYSLVKLGVDLQPTFSRLWMPIVSMYVGASIFGIIFLITDLITGTIISYGIAILAHVIMLLFKYRRIKQIKFLLIHGLLKQITILNDRINWSTQVNDTPQRILELKIDEEIKTYKTYDHELANEFRTGVDVLYHPKSKWILPLNYFAKYTID